MSQEDQPPEAIDPPRRWWSWLLAGTLLGVGFGGALGAAIGFVVECLIVALVNRLPPSKVRTVVGAILLIGGGILAGAGIALVLGDVVNLKKEMLIRDLLEPVDDFAGVSTWALIGGALGGLIATIDRLFMWVVYPHGVEPPTEPIEVLESDSEADD